MKKSTSNRFILRLFHKTSVDPALGLDGVLAVQTPPVLRRYHIAARSDGAEQELSNLDGVCDADLSET